MYAYQNNPASLPFLAVLRKKRLVYFRDFHWYKSFSTISHAYKHCSRKTKLRAFASKVDEPAIMRNLIWISTGRLTITESLRRKKNKTSKSMKILQSYSSYLSIQSSDKYTIEVSDHILTCIRNIIVAYQKLQLSAFNGTQSPVIQIMRMHWENRCI